MGETSEGSSVGDGGWYGESDLPDTTNGPGGGCSATGLTWRVQSLPLFQRNLQFFRMGVRIAVEISMNSRDHSTEPSGGSGVVFYLSLSVLIGVIAYAMIILPQRG